MLILKRPWTRQPQVAVPPSKLAFSLGCVRLLTPAIAPGALVDAVTGNVIWSTNRLSTIISAGRAAVNSDSASDDDYWLIPLSSEKQNSMAILWIGQYVAPANETNSLGIMLRDGTSSGGTIPLWNNGGAWAMRIGGTTYTAGGSVIADRSYTVCVNVSATAATLTVDGVRTISGSAPGATALTGSWYLGRNGTYVPGNASNTPIRTVLFAVFDRPVPDPVGLSANPWQLFAPQQIIIPTAAAAASSLPTLSASTYVPGSITATGWRPRVTAEYA